MRSVQAGVERVCAEYQYLQLSARRKGSFVDARRAASTRLRAEPITWKDVVKSSSLLLRSLATALLFISFASCSEKLDSSGVCSVLCPPVGGDVKNITLDAVTLDTTVQALSGLGTEPGLFLPWRGGRVPHRRLIA